jgi:hypothetical protein
MPNEAELRKLAREVLRAEAAPTRTRGHVGADTGVGALCAVCQKPVEDWLAVEGCSCNGFFMSKSLWAGPLRTMRTAKRRELGARIRFWRANGREAWVSIRDGPDGRVVISGERRTLSPGA